MKKTFTLTIVVGLLASLLALPGTALGQASFADYTGTETKIGDTIFAPADWTKPVVQVHFESVWEDKTTDIRADGTTYVSGKLTLTDPATFSGIMRGTSLTIVTGNGYEGTWVGSWQGTLVNGVGFYKAVAHGAGDLAGLKMMFDFTGDEAVPIEGRILGNAAVSNPNDRQWAAPQHGVAHIGVPNRSDAMSGRASPLVGDSAS